MISAFLNERRPAIASHSVCIECKRAGNVCVMVAHGTPCLGPVTHAGCGALCPSYHRGCYGCFGPMESPNAPSLAGWLERPARTSPTWSACTALLRRARPSGRRASASRPMAERRDPVILTEALARVEGEGAMHVRLRDGEVEDVELEIYEPPRFFEAFLRGSDVHRGAGHHRADLRHLPGRLPDERDRGDGGRLRRRGRRADTGAAAAAVLRRVGREPRTARVHAPRARLPRLRARLEMAREHREVVEGALALKKTGNELMRASAGARSIRSTSASAASTGRRRRAELAAVVPELEAAREFARASVAGSPELASLPSSRTTSSSRSPSRTGTRSRAGGCVSTAGLDLGPGEYEEHFVEEHVEHSTALHSRLRDGGGTYLVGPIARWALGGDAAVGDGTRGRRRGRARARVPNPFRVDRRARRGDPLRARRGAAHHRRLRAAGPAASRSRRAPAVGTAGARRRAACSGTATASTRAAPSSTRRSCRRPPRTRPGSSRHAGIRRGRIDLPDEELRERCEPAIRNYDPCISCSAHFLRLEVDRG